MVITATTFILIGVVTTINPTESATINPTLFPSYNPTHSPTLSPTNIPSSSPTYMPSISPTNNPSNTLSIISDIPTITPSNNPSKIPTNIPTATPTNRQSNISTNIPTISPIKFYQYVQQFIAELQANYNQLIQRLNIENVSIEDWAIEVIKQIVYFDQSIRMINISNILTNIIVIEYTGCNIYNNSMERMVCHKYNLNSISLQNELISTRVQSIFINGDKSPYICTDSPSKIPTNNPTNYPTQYTSNPSVIPTLIPSITPPKTLTISPSIMPTISPSITPTKTPTISPSMPSYIPPTSSPIETAMNNHTFNPSVTSTSYPIKYTNIPSITYTSDYPTVNTYVPTEISTNSPSEYPTHSPTKIPTIHTLNPSTISTTNVFIPTSFSTTNETESIHTSAILTASALWSSTFLYVQINSPTNTFITNKNNGNISCSNWFNNYTMSLIGGELAMCSWIDSNKKEIIQIGLSPIATIDIYNNYNLTIKQNTIEYIFNNQTLLFKEPIEINGIEYPLNISKPNIITFIPSEIGRCDNLILDARLTINLGGRNNAIFKWYIMNIYYIIYGEIVTVSNDLLSSISVATDIFIKLTVTNWYNASATKLFTVQKSSMNAVPLINLHGIDTYSANIGKLLNNKIDIYSTIVFNDNCENKIDLNEIEYEINWMVYIETQNKNINKQISELLNIYLLSQKNMTSISIDVNTQLQSGLQYLFVMNFKCIGNDFHCNVNTTHSILYEYSKLQCGIMGGVEELYNIKWNDFITFQMSLNG